MDDTIIVVFVVLMFAAFAVEITLSTFIDQFVKRELFDIAIKPLTKAVEFKDSNWFRAVAYRTVRLRVRQSPSGFVVEGSALHSPFWQELETYSSVDEAHTIIVRLLELANQWLELYAQSRIVNTYRY